MASALARLISGYLIPLFLGKLSHCDRVDLCRVIHRRIFKRAFLTGILLIVCPYRMTALLIKDCPAGAVFIFALLGYDSYSVV